MRVAGDNVSQMGKEGKPTRAFLILINRAGAIVAVSPTFPGVSAVAFSAAASEPNRYGIGCKWQNNREAPELCRPSTN